MLSVSAQRCGIVQMSCKHPFARRGPRACSRSRGRIKSSLERRAGPNQNGLSDVMLVDAARFYAEALEAGSADEDEVIAQIVGAPSPDDMSDVQLKYKDKVKAQVAKKAAEIEAAQQAGRAQYDLGVKLYARGRYADAEVHLSRALDEAAPFGRLGGDIQIQLALAKSALRQEKECIGILKALEETHPIRAVSRQAADLRFIMEAPKLQLGEDEKIMLPAMNHVADNRVRKGARAPVRNDIVKASKKEKTFEDKFWEEYQPPAYIRNRFVWAAWGLVSCIMIYYSIVYRDQLS